MATVARLRTREVVPRTLHPNFRDHGRMVDRPLLNILASLQRKHGEAFASEAGLRRMICEDTGHMPGVDTVPTALERLQRWGLVEQQWLRPGGLLPDGSPCTYGTRLVVVPQCRAQRRRLSSKNRREGVQRRPDRRALATLDKARATIAQRLAPLPTADASLERRKQEALAAIRDLEAAWRLEGEPRKPPD